MNVPLLDKLPRWAKPALIGAVVTLAVTIVLGQVLPRGYSGPTKAVDAYLTAIEDKDFDKAYDMLCRTSRSRGRADFDRQTAQAAASGGKVSHEMIGSTPERRGRSTVQFRQVTPKGSADLVAQAVEEDGKWKFCGYEDIPPPAQASSSVPNG